MGRDATKAAGNPWYQARKKAAEYDDRLCSRESAAEQLGMSVSSLADAELGNTKFMPVDKAVLMADRYNAPWLLNHYCLNECPIGCRHSLSDEVVGIDRVTVKLLKSLKTEQLGEVKDTLLDIAADGKITDDEKPALQEVLTYLDDLAKTVSELKTIGEMALNEDGDAHGSKYNDCIRTGQIAQAVEWLMEMAEILESEKRYTDALKLGMLTFYFATSGVYAEPVIEDRLAKQICRIVRETHLTLHEREELFLDTIRDDTLPEHIMSAKDCAYIFDVCAAGRVEDAREMLGRFVTAHAAK